jgi:hypothetical protein
MIAFEFPDVQTLKNVLIVFSGLIAPVTLVITTYIAIQQRRTNDLKVRHDLYDRRFAVYAALSSFLAQTQLNAFSINYNSIVPFGQKVKESYFLFDEEISNYLEKILQEGMTLCDLNAKLNDPRLDAGGTNETRPQVANEFGKQLDWFKQQLDSDVRKKFRKHLKLY